MRTAKEKRKTKETEIEVEVNLDGTGKSEISTGIGFFDHMLTALSKYSMIDLRILAKGDLETGTHHTIEDVGIVLGTALAKPLGDKKGIARAGFSELSVPELETPDSGPRGNVEENSGICSFKYMMDDAIAESIIDLSGRGRLIFEEKNGTELKYSNEFVGAPEQGFATEDLKEFFLALAENLKANIAVRLTRKGNSHHEVEATFKAFGKALRMAVEMDPRSKDQIPSTKGVI